MHVDLPALMRIIPDDLSITASHIEDVLGR
jgi:hypothetical protein